MPVLNLEALERLPGSSDYHFWADYVELLCLSHIDGAMAKSYLADRIQERKDGGEYSPADSPIENTNYDYESVEETTSMPSAQNARYERLVEDVFHHLEYREGTFGEHYPFSFSKEGNVLLLKSEWTPLRYFYIFTLLAANLRCLTAINEVTDLFEIVSLLALKEYLPGTPHVYVFGSNSYDDVKRYQGNLYNKTLALARDLRDTMLAQKNDFKPTNSGDGGLDLVAWVPFDDNNHSNLRVFGQCACGEAWVEKQHSSGFETWNAKIHLSVPPINMIFVPICYRGSDGEWQSGVDIHMSVLVDRVRIFKLAERFADKIPSRAIDIAKEALIHKSQLV